MENESDKKSLADRYRRVRAEFPEQSGQQAKDTYWLEREKSVVPTNQRYRYSLVVNGTERAIADANDGEAVILGGNPGPAQKIIAPDSQTIFTAVEEKLGLSRVNELRYGNAESNSRTVSAARQQAEDKAAKFRKTVPANKEAEHYLSDSHEMLNHQAQIGGLSTQGQEARTHISAALGELSRNKNQWNQKVGEHVLVARERLGEAPQTEETKTAPFEHIAGRQCAKALAAAELVASNRRDPQGRDERPPIDKSKNPEKDTGRSR